MKYVWLNLETGKFSNSWDEKTHQDFFEKRNTHGVDTKWKLIKYECLNDEDFEFYNMMKLK